MVRKYGYHGTHYFRFHDRPNVEIHYTVDGNDNYVFYRHLDRHEIIEDGDEFYDHHSLERCWAKCAGSVGERADRLSWSKVRRRLRDVPESLLHILKKENQMVKVSQQQIGGDHYKTMPDGYQPIQIAHKLGLNAAQFSVLKYLLRYQRKNGSEDIKKLIHFAQLILEQEYDVQSKIEYTEPQGLHGSEEPG